MIVKNRLLNYQNMYIYQDDQYFNFSLDSVLLSSFVTINKGTSLIVDLGTGNAPIPLLLTKTTSSLIYGFEIQKPIFELACKSVNINNLSNQIKIIHDDIKNLSSYFKPNSIDVITCNPPFFKYIDISNINVNEIKSNARHERLISLEQIISVSSIHLKHNGKLALVHRPERLIEIIFLMRKYNIEPKRLRMVYPKVNKQCNMILIEGAKNGKTGLKILPPLYSHLDDGTYTDEIKSNFGG